VKLIPVGFEVGPTHVVNQDEQNVRWFFRARDQDLIPVPRLVAACTNDEERSGHREPPKVWPGDLSISGLYSCYEGIPPSIPRH